MPIRLNTGGAGDSGSEANIAEQVLNPLRRPATDPVPDWIINPDLIGPTGVGPATPPPPAPVDPRARLDGESMTDWMTRLQIMDMDEERAENERLRPWTYKEMGLIEDPNSPGGIRELTEDERINGIPGSEVYTPMTQAERDAYDTEKMVAENAYKAATGTADIPTYVDEEIGKQRTANDILLSQRLGAKGAHVSTPGLTSRNTFDTNAAASKNAYSFGKTQEGMGLLSGYNSYLSNASAKNRGVYGSVENGGAGLIPMYQTAIQPYTFGQQLRDDQEQMNVNRNRSVYQGILGGVGSVAGMYLSRGGSK